MPSIKPGKAAGSVYLLFATIETAGALGGNLPSTALPSWEALRRGVDKLEADWVSSAALYGLVGGLIRVDQHLPVRPPPPGTATTGRLDLIRTQDETLFGRVHLIFYTLEVF